MSGRGRLLAVVAAQVLVMATWVGHHEHLRRTAPTFRIPLQPVDPFDLVRGRYFILNPVDAQVDRPRPRVDPDPLFDAFLAATNGELHFTGDLVLGFCPEAGPYGEIERLCSVRRPEAPAPATVEPAHEVTARVRLWLRPPQKEISDAGPSLPAPETLTGRIDFELDRFFVPNRATLPPAEQPGWELEVIYRPGQPLLPKRLWFRGEPIAL